MGTNGKTWPGGGRKKSPMTRRIRTGPAAACSTCSNLSRAEPTWMPGAATAGSWRAVGGPGAVPIGCDLNVEFFVEPTPSGPVVACRLPDLGWIRPAAVDGAYASLVAEHLPDLAPFLAGLAEAVTEGGPLVLVVNHPLFTAPESGPIVDPTDGEVFWRWGTYLEEGFTEEPAGDGRVTFYHRPLANILNSAAAAGWSLTRVVELGVSPESDDALLASQSHVPRLLGVRWTRIPDST